MKLSFAQKSLLKAIHRAGGALSQASISTDRSARILKKLELVELAMDSVALTAAGLGIATHLVGECECPEHQYRRAS